VRGHKREIKGVALQKAKRLVKFYAPKAKGLEEISFNVLSPES